jgi:TonB family protein
MKSVCSLLFCFLSLASFAQQPVYQDFDVDSAATPRGGMDYLTLFLQTNLRKPIKAEAEGTSRRVFVTGIVEPDGRITEVNLLKSLRPDLDREALRVFRLFNAWKPAQKGGVAVRQVVKIPVVFAANLPFRYVDGKRIDYYGPDLKLTTDSVAAQYKQVMPIDSLGMPTGAMITYQRNRNSWKEVSRVSLVRRKNVGTSAPGKPTYQLGYQNEDKQWTNQSMSYELTDDGTLVSKTRHGETYQTSYSTRYYDTGMVAETSREETGRMLTTSWYPTGQIQQIRFDAGQFGTTYKFERVQSYWAPDGKQQVIDGNGDVVFESERPSYANPSKQTRYTERGSYLDGKPQGVWAGRYADGSFSYEETYDRGKLQTGTAHKANRPDLTYTSNEQLPEFAGGMSGLRQFLSENLAYPVDAQRSRQQGKVLVSFTVCTDGSLCDYDVIQRVSPSLDVEALRVVRKMSGKWKPGIQRGEPVRVRFSVPINFSLY